MQMNSNTNIETKQSGLVQEQEEGWEARFLFNRRQGEKSGYTLVIFRQGHFIGHIPSSEIVVPGDVAYKTKKLGVKPGDRILSINLGSHPLLISSVLPTSDNYPRSYRILLDIKVRDHQKFAQEYIQDSDPVAHARVVIEGHIRRYLGSEEHDDITEQRIRECAEQALLAKPNDAIGLAVFNVPKVELWENADYTRKRQQERDHIVQVDKLRDEAYIDRIKEHNKWDLNKVQAQGEKELSELKNETDIMQTKHEEEKKDIQAAREQQRQKYQTISDYELKRIAQSQEHQLRIDVRDYEIHELDHQNLLSQIKANEEYKMQMLSMPRQHELQAQIRGEEIRQAEHEALLAEKKAQRELIQKDKEFQMAVRQKWIANFGDRAMPGMIQRILAAVDEGESELGDAATRTQLDFLFSMISERSGTSQTPNPPQSLLTQSDDTIDVQRAKTSELGGTDVSGDSEVLPGITQQRDQTIEIPDLGLKLIQTTLSPEQRQQASISTDVGFIVYQIQDSRSTDLDFFKVGDILFEINETSLTSISDLSQAISAHKVGQKVEAIVLRNETALDIEVKNP
jgi:hypothetical protein